MVAPYRMVTTYPTPAAWVQLGGDARLVFANDLFHQIIDGALESLLADLAPWLEDCLAKPGVQVATVQGKHGTRIVEWVASPLGRRNLLLLGRDLTLERQLRQTLAESRLRYKDLVEVSSDFTWETDVEGHFIFVSPRGALDYAADALIGTDPRLLSPVGLEQQPMPFASQLPVDEAQFWMTRADGGQSCLVASSMPLFDADGVWVGARGVCRDITEQVMREIELSQARNRERLLAHILRAMRDHVEPRQALSVAAGETAHAVASSGCRIHRLEEDGRWRLAADLVTTPTDRFPAEADEPVARVLADLARVTLDGGAESASQLDSHDVVCGPWHVLVQPCLHGGALNGAVTVWRKGDVWGSWDRKLLAGVADHVGIAHSHHLYQDRLRRLSEHDGLTGLLNRRTVLERVENDLARLGGEAALLFIDLDNFKAVNDVHGHHQGDAVLRMVSDLLEEMLADGDEAGRLGGDEFVLWLAPADVVRAKAVADRILAATPKFAWLSASAALPLGVSIGIAIARPGDGLQELTERADAAMYAAKRRGKNHHAVASQHEVGP